MFELAKSGARPLYNCLRASALILGKKMLMLLTIFSSELFLLEASKSFKYSGISCSPTTLSMSQWMMPMWATSFQSVSKTTSTSQYLQVPPLAKL